MLDDKWQTASFEIAQPNAPLTVHGIAYRGIGVAQMNGRFEVFHIGSGHLICCLVPHPEMARIIATEIAECCDWDWTGLHGYRNKEPNFATKFMRVVRRYPSHAYLLRDEGSKANESAARAVAFNLD